MLDRRFGLDAREGFVVCRLARGFQRPLVRVGDARQGEPVVALLDGFVRLLHRGGRGGERLGRVLLGAGRARGLDGALSTIDFLLRRFGTGSREDDRADRDDNTTHRTAV